MTSAKLSASLLVYKDLPSAMLAQLVSPASEVPGDRSPVERSESVEPALSAGNNPVLAEVAVGAVSPADDATLWCRPIIQLGLAGSGIAAATAGALFFFIHAYGQTGPTITAL